MVRMSYGSALGTFGEHRCSPNAPNRIPMHLERFFTLQMSPMHYHSVYGPYLWAIGATVAHWVHLVSIDALQIHSIKFQCIWVHLESVFAL